MKHMTRKQKIIKYREFQKRAMNAGCSKSQFFEYVILDAKALRSQSKESGLYLNWSEACLIVGESLAIQQENIENLRNIG